MSVYVIFITAQILAHSWILVLDKNIEYSNGKTMELLVHFLKDVQTNLHS